MTGIDQLLEKAQRVAKGEELFTYRELLALARHIRAGRIELETVALKRRISGGGITTKGTNVVI